MLQTTDVTKRVVCWSGRFTGLVFEKKMWNLTSTQHLSWSSSISASLIEADFESLRRKLNQYKLVLIWVSRLGFSQGQMNANNSFTHWLSVLPLRFLGISMFKDIAAAEEAVIRLGRELLCSSSTSTSSEMEEIYYNPQLVINTGTWSNLQLWLHARRCIFKL